VVFFDNNTRAFIVATLPIPSVELAPTAGGVWVRRGKQMAPDPQARTQRPCVDCNERFREGRVGWTLQINTCSLSYSCFLQLCQVLL
jgi:hypothetical protein